MSRFPYDSLEYDIYERLQEYVQDRESEGVSMVDTVMRVQSVLIELLRDLSVDSHGLSEQAIRADERSKVIDSMKRLL